MRHHSLTGYGATTGDLRIVNSGSLSQLEMNFHINVFELMIVSIAIKDFKLSKICLLLKTDETTRIAINKWRSPSKHILAKCFDSSSGIVSSEESAQNNISNTNSPQCDRGFIKQGRSHSYLKKCPSKQHFN